MVLHILPDDKFTDYVLNQFLEEEMQSELVVIPSGAGHTFIKHENIKIISYPSEEFSQLLKRLDTYSGVILHGIFWPYCEDIIKAASSRLKIAWYFWGAELYARPDVIVSSIAPITKFLYHIHNWKKCNKIRNTQWQLDLYLYKRINYCLTSMYEEYVYAKKYTHSEMQFLWYTYYSVDDTLGSLLTKRSKGNNVMLCNSAALNNNVFDAVFRLSLPSYKTKIEGREIIMPLSYGCQWIRNLMLKLGPKCFDKYTPLIDFLPREQYNEIMLSCSTLILPYHTPAGQGNIITALWLGLRVYLSERSIAYNYFKRIGAHIYSFETDFEVYGCEILPDESVEHNRQILRNVYGVEEIRKANNKLIRILEGENTK